MTGRGDSPVVTHRAHAKVNLLLRILAREASGHHGIETLFQRLALHDTVRVEVGVGDRTLHCDGPAMPADGLGAPADNLAWRAAAAYVDATGWDTGWAITIDKRIPVGGGLGGGSADAAAVLRAMEQLSPRPLGQAALLALAGTLGSDVPFLTLDAPLALAWGRGDRLLALPSLPPAPVTLATFPRGVHTGQAYGAVAAARAGQPVAVAATAYDVDAFATWAQVADLAANDFETVVPSMHDGVATWLPRVRAHAQHWRTLGVPSIGLLSGSGATCFLLGPVGADAGPDGAAPALVVEPDDDPTVRLVHTRTL
jgi:4-diphosphocytidyl-2-C-methyl-D-erythritol kinase